MIILITGESGTGKTTVGRMLAINLSWKYFEGDDFHPDSNIEKMKKGVPLNDEDRYPWLKAIRRLIDELIDKNENAVITCSALKKSYRDILLKGTINVKLVFLYGDYQLIKSRLLQRKDHFFDPALLKSQQETLEEPEKAVKINVKKKPEEIVSIIQQSLLR